MKVLAITGGGQGIGRAVAFYFARAGYAISLSDINTKAGKETLSQLESSGAQAVFVTTDISKPAQVKRWFQMTVKKLGCPEILINNAAISHNLSFLKLRPEDFDKVIAVNLSGSFHCAQTAAQQMIRHKKKGAIINIASTRAFMSEPGTEAYSSSKGGILSLTHAMAMSLAPYHIRVNSISPGWIETRDWLYSKHATTPIHSAKDKSQHPVGRVGKPDDVAQTCFFLATSASFMTGQNIILDGGMTTKMIYET